MDDLLIWITNQPHGIGTFQEFQRRALALRAVESKHAALLRLLADIAGHFSDAYDDQPLAGDVAAKTFSNLKNYLGKAIVTQYESPQKYLALLNDIGLIEVD